ncbi:hypothetical protein LPJ72_005078 [Coemansia sp. Benny D160-2]|nr:hypothetical protein LPJ72_005078 [Coemansia sp. Benny D160-2]
MPDNSTTNKVVLDAPHRFVDVSSGILRTLTADIGKQTQRISMEFAVTVDGLEHSTTSHMNAISKLLESTHRQLETTKRDLDHSVTTMQDCSSLVRKDTAPHVKELVDEAADVLKSMKTADELAEKGHVRLVEQMKRRNEDFELKLRRDHEEFSRAHARRLANVLQYQF